MSDEEKARVVATLQAVGEYITALRQAIYSQDPMYSSPAHFKHLDSLSQKEWPQRERLLQELMGRGPKKK